MKLFFRIACLALLVSGTLAQGFDLSDALGDDTPTDPPKKKDDGGLNILDAFGDDEPYKPDVNPPKPPSGGGGGGSFDDSLHDLAGGGGGGGSYDPHGDRYGGRGGDPGYDTNSGGNQPTQAAGSGSIAGIASAIGVALLGAASSYFAYQKKKLCFKIQGGQDPERGTRHNTQSDPQVMSNLLQA